MAETEQPVYPPIPQPDAMTQFFWDGVNEHKLLILRCDACGYYVHWPRPICNKCLSENLSPAQVSGKGTLHSYSVVLQATDPYFAKQGSYTYAVVELPEQPELKLVTNIVDCPESELRVDMPVEVVFREVAPGCTLPLFRPAR